MSDEMRKLLDAISPLINETTADVGSAEGQEIYLTVEKMKERVEEIALLIELLPDHSIEKMEGHRELGALRNAVDSINEYARNLAR
jgi:hypothetical protein